MSKLWVAGILFCTLLIGCTSPELGQFRSPSGKAELTFVGSTQRVSPVLESELKIHFPIWAEDKIQNKNYDLKIENEADTFLTDLSNLENYLSNQKDLASSDEVLDILSDKDKIKSIQAIIYFQKQWKSNQRRITDQNIVTSLEIINAINNNFIPSVKLDYQLLKLPIELINLTAPGYPVVGPQASNLAVSNNSDLSLLDPITSSFWQSPKKIASYELFASFGRTSRNSIDGKICEFDKPKTGYGVHAGFQIHCGDKGTADKFKVKFGNETHSGPFNTRIYNLLGYNVPVIDYVKAPEFKYDRRIISQFNMRHVEKLNIKLGPVKLLSVGRNAYKNPFEFIDYAILDKGKITGAELATRLLKKTEPKAELDPGNYNEEFEKTIRTLVFQQGTITKKESLVEVGPWQYSELDHSSRRELRGLQILAAWVGNFDMRMDNTRVMFEKDGTGTYQLKHQLVDVGSGLGKASSLITRSGSNIEKMEWVVSKTFHSRDRTTGRVSKKIELVGLMTFEVNKAFRSMTIEDAQWMIRKIAQITEPQLIEALAASGLTAAELKLGLEKLISRRNQLIVDFGLQHELPIRRTDSRINYDPNQSGPWIINTVQGPYTIPDGNVRVENGKLIAN